MSKIIRQTFVQFGVNVNAAADICAFGTPATGSPVYTTTLSTLQGQTAWTTGWAAETISSNRPFLEDMNATHYVFSYMLAYLFEMGIPEWDSGTTYYTNSIVQSGGVLYQSLIDTNTNNAVGTNSSWRQFTAPAPYVKVSEVETSGTGGGSVSSGSWITRVLNNKDSDTASIASLSSNQVTLPAGTYKVNISAPFWACGPSQIRLQNITTSTTLLTGTSVNALNQYDVQAVSTIVGQITLASSSALAVQYQATTNGGGSGNGLGYPCSFGNEVYTVAEFTKIS